MAKINLKISEFVDTYTGINGHRTLNVSKLHFLKYGMTAGMPLFGGKKVPPLQTLTLAMYKAIGISCALDFSGPFLKRSCSYTNLDPTEQANISTWVGMAGASLMADINLGISQLLHAGALKQNGTLCASDYRSRKFADFIGQDKNNNWHVLEAKARQNNPSKAERAKWKNQAQTIATINGVSPSTRSYCYTRINDPCILELVDPPIRYEDDNVDFYVNEIGLMDTYYQVLLDVLSNSETRVNIDNNPIRFTMAGFDPITETYTYVGLHDKVYRMLEKEKIPPKIEQLGEKISFTKPEEYPNKQDIELLDDFRRNQFFMASDGVAILTARHQEDIYDYRYQ